ncbi:YbgC/YbaW family acyl-CoA thioester hydrolase [Aquabacterium commune]|uniref:YbgC/YbaW family acyl-CoA thioester hydrolase n=1 Tax=Aquabacterium commune TaxID=70586 RepID=A0A4R6REH9_9BURK|nr:MULTISPECIES: YbgC/FadM family acyl-CoA thioesterase [Aquabacterium]MBT9610972.1 YbgC/FadM family acyl-CoA thioesterase [Aquabacterium sp.]TDP84485.1 YbgC/YbaW family acyl-CoA thioester hydrolase [Aquabacterium commune]|tara:strand:- start:542 stop:1405 length:864 start_codon:yes stop_codon:yes gene_type:complete
MTQPADFRFHHRLRVRWVEVDAQQVVFNGHYLTYLDVAVTEFWRTVGLPYPDAMRHVGGDIFVRRNTLQYHAPARLDDWLDIGMRCERIGTSSITLNWAVWSQGRLLVTGEVVYVFTDLASGRSAPVPEALRDQLDAHMQGAPVTQLVCGPWDALAEAARAVRLAVFVGEQGIPESDEWDEDDATAVHAVVRNLAGLPLATGRLILSVDAGHARIGRMAVLRSARGVGLGREVLQALIAQARERGVQHIGIHAQCSAMPLYAQAGFVPVGEVFDEVGIPHQGMTLAL